MIHSYELPNYWTWKIFLCINDANESLKKIAEYYNEFHDTNINESIDGESPCCLYDSENLTAIICINEWKMDAYHVGVIAHEVMHLLVCISEVCECPINMHTSECWAYTMNSFMETFIELLNKNEKKNRKKVKKNARKHIQ